MKGKFLLWTLLFVLLAGALTATVMYLWNWLMPEIFGLTTITFWQALGILVLSKILFGAHWSKHKHSCHGGHHYGWKEKFKSKWNEMSDEDKKKWEQKFCGMKSKTENNS
ncbi:MAG: hypothetical protein IPM77_02660 [Crocinitomicaceae bacterium]|nr:hypothetical protein [Crocinitomicaceae bacterium]